MPDLNEKPVGCPYCGETITILVDDSLPEQQYVEDCHVCCRPIVLNITVSTDEEVSVTVRAENE